MMPDKDINRFSGSTLGRITRRSIRPRLIFIGDALEVEERIARTLKAKMAAMEKLDNPEKAGSLVV